MTLHPDFAAVLAGERRWALHVGDCRELLAALPERSLGHVVGDLPSAETRLAQDARVDGPEFWEGVWRALPEAGAAVLMASSLRFAANLIAAQPKTFRHDLVWRKSIATGFLNAKKQPLRAHEFVLVFCRRPPLFTVQMSEGPGPITGTVRSFIGSDNYDRSVSREGRARTGATDRFPRSVLEFGSIGTTDASREHPQQKPVDLMEWLLASYTKPGDVVLDPTAGSGTTGVAALRLGRRVILCERDPAFASCARERMEAEEAGASLRLQRLGQGSLFSKEREA